MKEERKKTTWGVLFEGGRGQEVTGEPFMALQASLEAQATKTKADVARRKVELARRKEIWEVQKVEHNKRKQEFIAQGLPMARAGPPPLLKNVVLNAETNESAVLSTSITSVKNIQKGKRRQHSESIGSLLGEDFDDDEPESDEELEVWSAHDESDVEQI